MVSINPKERAEEYVRIKYGLPRERTDISEKSWASRLMRTAELIADPTGSSYTASGDAIPWDRVSRGIGQARDLATEVYDVTLKPAGTVLKDTANVARKAYLDSPAVKYFDLTPSGLGDAATTLFGFMTPKPEDRPVVKAAKRMAGVATAYTILC